jgi:hypothetical protein
MYKELMQEVIDKTNMMVSCRKTLKEFHDSEENSIIVGYDPPETFTGIIYEVVLPHPLSSQKDEIHYKGTLYFEDVEILSYSINMIDEGTNIEELKETICEQFVKPILESGFYGRYKFRMENIERLIEKTNTKNKELVTNN